MNDPIQDGTEIHPDEVSAEKKIDGVKTEIAHKTVTHGQGEKPIRTGPARTGSNPF